MFGSIRCHYCGSKSSFSRSVRQFQCSNCEAPNFLDGKGNIVEPPPAIVSPKATGGIRRQNNTFETFTKPLPSSLEHQQEQAFCRTCLQNQHFYNEALSNYLPDESHPRYRQFAKELPHFKMELEQRYPLICTACATKAQHKINRADYYALATNASIRCAETRARKGQTPHGLRESWDKYFMRTVLNLVGFTLTLSLHSQIVYHIYGILVILLNPAFSSINSSFAFAPHDTADIDELDSSTQFVFDPSITDCARQALYLNFDSSCYDRFSALIPRILVLSACLIWYNPGLKEWFHPTYRIEAVSGQRNYFYMQLINLIIRAWAWKSLSDLKAVDKGNRDQILAMHGFVIFFTLVTQHLASRSIASTKWAIQGHVMPRPEDKDVLGIGAGPAQEHYTPKTSGIDPYRHLHDDNVAFDPTHLKRKNRKPANQPHYPKLRLSAQEPTPEYSEDDDDDAMDLDATHQPRLQPSHTYFRNPNAPPLAINDMAQELSAVEAAMQTDQESQQRAESSKLRYCPTHSLHPSQQQPIFSLPPKRPFTEPPPRPDFVANPFQGTLPPAPMSMGRRLRNPVIPPVHEPEVPVSQQPGFFQKMAEGLKPAQFPEKGTNAEVQKGKWVLPQDVKTLGGLEERFGTVFSLDEAQPRGGEGGWLKGWFGG